MDSLPTWAAWSVISAVLLLSPALAFLIVVAVEILIDLLMEVGATADCTIAAGAIGWALFRKRSAHPELAPQTGPEQKPDEAALAAPPM
jgi:hypothetical protein